MDKAHRKVVPWDPKENGALMIVIWNAIVLHARWGGMVKDRGMAVLAIGGNIVTAWSWFGVNELDIGLHSYGGSSVSMRVALVIFILANFAIASFGWVCALLSNPSKTATQSSAPQ